MKIDKEILKNVRKKYALQNMPLTNDRTCNLNVEIVDWVCGTNCAINNDCILSSRRFFNFCISLQKVSINYFIHQSYEIALHDLDTW